MSFSSDTKNELARLEGGKDCCRFSELSAFIRLKGKLTEAGEDGAALVLASEVPTVIRHFNFLIKECLGFKTKLQVGQEKALNKRKNYIIILNGHSIDEILKKADIRLWNGGMFGITGGIPRERIKTECCRKAYLRGAFLATGTMTHPQKGYQLEILCDSEELATDIKRLFNSFAGIHGRTIKRKNQYVVYVKESEQILDLLAIMGAYSQYFKYDNVRLKKELRNEANRISNCDQANIDKTLSAAGRQIENIEKVGPANLPEKLQEIAYMRLENPYASMTELGEMLTPPIKKSGVNHRMKRIEELAREKT